ncbi:substrate-binding periplasmic protein [Marinimicrobium sp. ARAG 43.8]|uniref:substrate-binding periplasmic protein n=1 Tax=Marinimicrobium sp. ARAG 43.8 TaxID=3418719 RepID=UPI003CF31708
MNKTPVFRTVSFGLVGALLLFSGHSPLAQSEEPTIEEPTSEKPTHQAAPAPDLKFITIDVAPWAHYNPETGDQQGAFVAIIDAIAALTGFNIETSLTPFARVDRELESGDHDCTILVPRDEEVVVHGELVAQHDVGVLSHKDHPITHYDQLHGETISLLRGSAITPRFDNDTGIQKVYDTDYLIALRKLDRHRVAGIAGAVPTLRYLAVENGLDDMLAKPLKLTDIPLMLQCSRQSPHLDLMPRLNEAIITLRRNGRLQEITDLYHF